MTSSPTLFSSVELAEMRGLTPRTRTVSAQWYEGSRWSPNRSWIWYPVQDARKDLDRFTRYELNKNGEALWKNSPFIRGIIERLVTLTIGTGMHPTPKSSDPKFNEAVKKFWKQICKQPCVDNKKSMNIYQRVKMRARFKAGESFTLFCHDERTGKDKIQGLEWFRCSGAGGKKKQDQLAIGTSDSYYATAPDKQSGGDGIEFYPSGYPKNYRFTGLDEPVPENLVVHHFTPLRDEQVRGETILAAALNMARDVKDILDLEKQAVKDASSKQDIIQTMTGDFDPEAMLKLQFGTPPDGTPTPYSLPVDDTQKIAYYNTKFQGAPVVLKTGDKYTPYVPARPGNAWQGFMAFLANMIVLGTGGFPPSLVIPIDIGGTDIRRDLKIGQKVVEAWQNDMAYEFQAIWEYFVMGAIEDRILPKAPEDWNNVSWHFTESLTVDRAQAAMDRDDVEAGLMSYAEYHGRQGDDGDEYELQVIKEARRRRFRITGTPESEPFKDAAEFAQFLNFNSNAIRNQAPVEADPDSGSGRRETKPALQKAA